MSSKARTRVLAAMAAVAALTLAACGSSSTPSGSTSPSSSSSGSQSASPKPLRIGFLPPTMGVPAFKGLADGMTAAGKATGDTVVTAEAKFDPATQIQTVQQWVRLGQVDAIWIIPVAAKAVAPSLKEATDKGIVVLGGGVPADYGFDSIPPGMSFSAIDQVAFGKGIGDLMAACVNKRLSGKSQVIYVGPNQAAQSTTDINNASKSALAAGAPGATIVQELVAKSDLASDQVLIASALQAHPDSDGFMAGDAESTLAGLNAYTAAGKDATKICIVGNGGTDAQVAAVKSGKVYGVVAFDFIGDLGQNMQQLHSMAADPKAPGTQLTVPIKTIDS